MGKALLLIVRRGALARFDALKQKASDLRVVVEWDRRQGDRRLTSGPGANERRSGERRREPPFTWEAADFLVAGDTEIDAKG